MSWFNKVANTLKGEATTVEAKLADDDVRNCPLSFTFYPILSSLVLPKTTYVSKLSPYGHPLHMPRELKHAALRAINLQQPGVDDVRAMEAALKEALRNLQGEKSELEIELEEEKSYSASLAEEVEVRLPVQCFHASI